mgnify:CR=1 FL=1
MLLSRRWHGRGLDFRCSCGLAVPFLRGFCFRLRLRLRNAFPKVGDARLRVGGDGFHGSGVEVADARVLVVRALYRPSERRLLPLWLAVRPKEGVAILVQFRSLQEVVFRGVNGRVSALLGVLVARARKQHIKGAHIRSGGVGVDERAVDRGALAAVARAGIAVLEVVIFG